MIRADIAHYFAQLKAHRQTLHDYTIAEFFKSDPHRFAHFHIALDDLLFDFSKHHITAPVVDDLLGLAKVSGLEVQRERLFSGAHINNTEDRPALHMALRDVTTPKLRVDGVDIMPLIATERARVNDFAQAVRDQTICGAEGDGITDIINIGIGGSDLGPAMAARALSPYIKSGIRLHFVSNVDGADLADTVKNIDLRKALFIISSKTFTTQETMANARAARALVVNALGEQAVPHHFCAVSTKVDLVAQFGISAERTFGFWDWVGGRYSIWSSIGLALTIGIGPELMQQLLQGGHDIDEHFKAAPLNKNIPVMMALLGIWYRNIWGYGSHAIIPYDQRLARFPAYLQQLDMESNGKSVTRNGQSVSYATAPLLWGEPGTNGQHAFFQMLHQGTDIIPVDFIVAARPTAADQHQHELLFANCLAQSEALMIGRSADQTRFAMQQLSAQSVNEENLIAHKTFVGNRPSSTLIYSDLSPRNLGRLIALYEHKVFVQSVIWDINPFDQWGVELGKDMCGKLVPFVRDQHKDISALNQSTAGLISHRRNLAKT